MNASLSCSGGSETRRDGRCRRGWPFPRCLLLAAVALGGSCTSAHHFKVDAIRNVEDADAPRSFVIVHAGPAPAEPGARVEEINDLIRTALSAKGMFESPPGTPVDAVIEVDYGMEPPRKEEVTASEPILTHVSRSETRADPNGSSSTISVVTSETIVTGYRNVTTIVTFHPKFLRITARETPAAAGSHPPRELWSVYVTNEDKDPDLAKYVPLLVAAAMDSLSEHGSSSRTVSIREGDERVTFVERGI